MDWYISRYMRYIVKRFAKNGLHVILRKRDGFEEGMEVIVKPLWDKREKKAYFDDEFKEALSELIAEKVSGGSYRDIRERLLRDEEFIERLRVKLMEYRSI